MDGPDPQPFGLCGVDIARRHPVTHDLPTPDFFDGLLLGNGDLGICLTTRPDALGIHIGTNDCWDLRLGDDPTASVLPFAEVRRLWERAAAIGDGTHVEQTDPAFREYTDRIRAAYQTPWPRPWPCGTIWLHWDPRTTEVRQQHLDIADGVARIHLGHDDRLGTTNQSVLTCVVSHVDNHLSVSADGPVPITSVVYCPHVDPRTELPAPVLSTDITADHGELAGAQRLPAARADHGFDLRARVTGSCRRGERYLPPRAFFQTGPDSSDSRPSVALHPPADGPFRLDVAVAVSPRCPEHIRDTMARVCARPVARVRAQTAAAWREFWARSAMTIDDPDLEQTWYRNQYFLACCLRPGSIAPGMYGNWISGDIGQSWHGDYHLDYNTQQCYWGVFSSNHVEQHLPYVELLEQLQPMARGIARDHFGLPGAYYPVSVYPFPPERSSYSAPPWFYMMCVSPWAVQSLWWHYLYTADRDFLRRAYPMIADVARFLSAYATLGDDGHFHVVPTVSSENWGCTADFRLNRDAVMDLALGAFVLRAAIEASVELADDPAERAEWQRVLDGLADYPTGVGPYGEVWLDVADAPVEHVYNVPAPTVPVFPGEQVGIGVGERWLPVARRTATALRLEGGNDVVFRGMVSARLGVLDLDRFAREIRYCRLGNGTCFDRVRQIGGRYDDFTDFDFMGRMGVWVENFALPAVLNECALQSYTGTVRLFPNTVHLPPTAFANLRAVGAFLVSARWDGEAVAPEVIVHSERGRRCRIELPWDTDAIHVTADGQPVQTTITAGCVEFATAAGTTYRVVPSL